MTARELLIYLAIKFKGDQKQIIDFIERHEEIEEVELPPIKSKAITMLDEDYPEEFKQYPFPPIVLFYYGDISLLSSFSKNVAVIGTRKASEYGIEITKSIVKDIAEEVTIVSGLAKGIDALAHKTCIESGGKTIAVLGCGIDVCYPKSNQDLYDIIKEKHLLISEYYGDIEPTPDKFPIRNRIIAMISKTVVITEAYPRSGTSITATFALNYNKNVCCVPYRSNENSLCNYLIKEGAYLVESGNDVLEDSNIKKEKAVFEL